jgi:alkylated DNA nucleotide flippase Atl1
MKIKCVQLVPYEVGGELVLGSSILIPLPEAGDYEVRVAQKSQAAAAKKATQAALDHDQARAFVASIPPGRWASDGDVAAAGGSPQWAMGVGSWLSSKGDAVPNVYRVLSSRGEVRLGWKADTPGLPPDPEGVRQLLQEEGVTFDETGRASQAQRWTAGHYTAGSSHNDDAPPS